MHSLKKILGINLRYYRNIEGLSQDNYYSKYHLSVKHMANVERGCENVTLDFVDKISNSLNIKATDLLTFDESKIINKRRVDQKTK